MKIKFAFPVLALTTWGCSSAVSINIKPQQMPRGGIRYDGSLAGPYGSFTEMAETACTRLSEHALTRKGSRGSGYCALFFSVPENSRKWAISYIAEMDGDPSGLDRACALPEDPVNPGDKSVLQLGGAFSGAGDRSAGLKGLWRPTQFFNQTAGKTWNYDMLTFSIEGSGNCTVFAYISFRRDLTVLHDGDWLPIGTIYSQNGDVHALKGE